jgi:hypothetical protein
MDWHGLLQAAEKPGQEVSTAGKGSALQRFTLLKRLALNYAPRAAAVLGLVFVLWIARQLYFGGRIPFLREPEEFRYEEVQAVDADWPMPVDWE